MIYLTVLIDSFIIGMIIPKGAMVRTTKRSDILNATLKLLVQHDLDQTSMDMIAKEAQVGMGTIYNYFASKEELVNVLYSELKREVGKAIMEGHKPDAPLHEQFFSTWRNICYFYLNHPETYLFLERYAYSPIITGESKVLGEQFWEEPMQIIEEARQHQILKDLPLNILIVIAASPIYTVVREHILGHFQLTDQQIEASITACWDAIKL
jgi:AcrR family transcriptional regulator